MVLNIKNKSSRKTSCSDDGFVNLDDASFSVNPWHEDQQWIQIFDKMLSNELSGHKVQDNIKPVLTRSISLRKSNFGEKSAKFQRSKSFRYSNNSTPVHTDEFDILDIDEDQQRSPTDCGSAAVGVDVSVDAARCILMDTTVYWNRRLHTMRQLRKILETVPAENLAPPLSDLVPAMLVSLRDVRIQLVRETLHTIAYISRFGANSCHFCHSLLPSIISLVSHVAKPVCVAAQSCVSVVLRNAHSHQLLRCLLSPVGADTPWTRTRQLRRFRLLCVETVLDTWPARVLRKQKSEIEECVRAALCDVSDFELRVIARRLLWTCANKFDSDCDAVAAANLTVEPVVSSSSSTVSFAQQHGGTLGARRLSATSVRGLTGASNGVLLATAESRIPTRSTTTKLSSPACVTPVSKPAARPATTQPKMQRFSLERRSVRVMSSDYSNLSSNIERLINGLVSNHSARRVDCLNQLLHTHGENKFRSLSEAECRRVMHNLCEVLGDANLKVFSLALTVLHGFVSAHYSTLHSWLYQILLKHFVRVGCDLPADIISKIRHNLVLTRSRFACAKQVEAVVRIMSDEPPRLLSSTSTRRCMMQHLYLTLDAMRPCELSACSQRSLTVCVLHKVCEWIGPSFDPQQQQEPRRLCLLLKTLYPSIFCYEFDNLVTTQKNIIRRFFGQ